MAYKKGILSNNAANVPFLLKNGLLVDRQTVNDSVPNNFLYYADDTGTGRLHWVQPADTSNQTFLRNPNGVKAYAFNLIAMATPATPVITNAGTAGATTDAYKIVAKNGAGATLATTAASAAGSTTTANATLSATNYNIVTFASVTGAASYDVYRTTAAGTPSTTGKIGSVAATIADATGIQPATYAFNDTGIAGDGTTAPTANTSGQMPGGVGSPQLGTPVGVTATVNGTAGSTTISYKVVANGTVGTTAASSAATVTTANATLSTTNSVTVAWDAVPGAVSYTLYRTAAGGTPSTTGALTGATALTVLTFTDTGVAGDSTTAPTVNTTGNAVIAIGPNYIPTTTGSANALSATLNDATGNPVAVVPGLMINVKLGAGLQAGANTFNLNAHGTDAVKEASNPATNLAVVFTTGSIATMVFDGTVWQCVGR